MKWFLLLFALVVIFSLVTGFRGGAQDAAGNYNKLLRGEGISQSK
ncbi:MAG: hypothetical protein ACNI3C_02720 [Candidatus Marinarcus sp.]